jgi:hypothetical protein
MIRIIVISAAAYDFLLQFDEDIWIPVLQRNNQPLAAAPAGRPTDDQVGDCSFYSILTFPSPKKADTRNFYIKIVQHIFITPL